MQAKLRCTAPDSTAHGGHLAGGTKATRQTAHHHVCVRHMLHCEGAGLSPRRRLQLAAAHADEPERARPQDGAVQACGRSEKRCVS